MEIKFNGCRAGVISSKHGTQLDSRSNGDLTDAFPELIESLVLPPNTIIDSEIVVLKGNKDDFNALQQRVKNKGKKAERLAIINPANIIAFDCILFKGKDIKSLPIEERRKYLTDIPGTTPIHWISEDGISLFEKVKAIGLEGIVAKRKGSVYEGGARDDRWVKVRVKQVGIFQVVGYTTDGQWLESFALADELGNFVGRVGSGMLNHTNRVTMLGIMSSMPDGKQLSSDKNIIWKETSQTLKIEYSDVSKSGSLIHPSIIK
jgi:ATP-dependent DNA ligase